MPTEALKTTTSVFAYIKLIPNEGVILVEKVRILATPNTTLFLIINPGFEKKIMRFFNIDFANTSNEGVFSFKFTINMITCP